MKKFYAESTLRKKYRELGIPKEVYTKVHLYLAACANFYRAISADDVFKVIGIAEKRMGKNGEKLLGDDQLLTSMSTFSLESVMLLDDYSFEQEPQDEEKGDALERECMKMLFKGKGHYASFVDSAFYPITSDGFCYEEGDYVLSRDDFERILDLREREFGTYCVFSGEEIFCDYDGSERYIVNGSEISLLEDEEEMELDMCGAGKIIKESDGKDLYVPEVILYYLSLMYYEETPAVKNMSEYLIKKSQDADEIIIERLIRRIYEDIRTPGTEGNAEDVTKLVEEFGISFEDTDDVREFMECYMDMNNNTRLPINKGYTPNELSERQGERPVMHFADSIRPGDEVVVNSGGTVVKGKKIGPNEPCPCGSGKKYKKCCGRLN